MYKVEVYLSIRRACLVEGKSIRQVSEEFGINRRTVRKMIQNSAPPGYQRKQEAKKPKLGPHLEFIHQILKEDKACPKKQRHTAKRILVRLKEERGYEGGYTVVRDYIKKYHTLTKEMFCPLEHPPGEAQVDFGEAWVVIAREKQKCHIFVMDIPQSDGCFVKAYPHENTEAFCEGHASAFIFFEGVPTKILYDNTTIAVSFILGKRKKTRAFCELQSHYLFEEKFARVRKGNDKGKVEGLVGYARRNFMVPIPEFETFDDFNAYLKTCCLKRQKDILYGQKESIEERLKRDTLSFLPLPEVPFEACACQSGRVSSQSLVRYKGNDYSVPIRYGHRDVFIKGYVQEVIISCGTEIIAKHSRNYGKGEKIFNPLHYLPLLERKTGAFDQAAPLSKWELPAVFRKCQNLLEQRDGKEGKREYIRILSLLETYSLEELEIGIKDALTLGALNSASIKHILLCHLDEKPVTLNMMEYPNLPHVFVTTTKPQDYGQLLGESC